MIKDLFETHLLVKRLNISVEFYQNVLGLMLGHIDHERKIAFFWIGKRNKAMLGLWERPKVKIEKRHFAFRTDLDFVLHKSVSFLKGNNLKPYNFLNDQSERPMVFSWMPALAIYFEDPDGNELEFIAPLKGKAKPELGVIPYEAWLKIS